MTSKSTTKRATAPKQEQQAPSPRQDKGPPPRYPAPPFGSPVGSTADRIFVAGRAAKPIAALREDVQAISTFRAPPRVAAYKAEVLAWLDAREAWDAS